jgi:hypothetical protein
VDDLYGRLDITIEPAKDIPSHTSEICKIQYGKAQSDTFDFDQSHKAADTPLQSASQHFHPTASVVDLSFLFSVLCFAIGIRESPQRSRCSSSGMALYYV